MNFQPLSFYIGCLIGVLLICLPSLAAMLYFIRRAEPAPDEPSPEELAVLQIKIDTLLRANGRNTGGIHDHQHSA